MPFDGGEYLRKLGEMASSEIYRGDFVTLERTDDGHVIYEHILTFSGIRIKRGFVKDACYAPLEEGEENI